MSSYEDLFMQEYSAVYEKAKAKGKIDIKGYIKKTTTGKGLKAVIGDTARDAKNYYKIAERCRKDEDYKQALTNYKISIEYYNKALKEVDKIEDETILSWVIKIVAIPGVIPAQVLQGGSVKGATRESARQAIKKCIRKCESQISKCQ